jgi:hypothetical protein
MFLTYGNHTHDPAECEIQISQKGIRGPLGRMYAIESRWDIIGRIHAADQSSVNRAIASLVAAYQQNGQDLILHLDDGSPSTHALYSSRSINGTKVVAGDFPKGSGAEFSTFRNYHVAVEAEFAYTGEGSLVSYQESIAYKGTGDGLWGYTECVNGPPIAWRATARGISTAIQRGSVKMAGGAWPQLFVPGPIWPSQELGHLREMSPVKEDSKYGERTIQWTYHFVFGSNPGIQYPV